MMPQLLSDGAQAFIFQALALHFCALHKESSLNEKLTRCLLARINV